MAEGKLLVTKAYEKRIPTYETQPDKVFVDLQEDRRLKNRLKDGGVIKDEFALEIKGRF